jgi:hypothetical protein
MNWPDNIEMWDGKWTSNGKHFVFTTDRDGGSDIYEYVEPRWFEFWKKPWSARLTAGQVQVVATTPSRDVTGLFVLGQLAQGEMRVYGEKEKHFVPYLDGLPASDLQKVPAGGKPKRFVPERTSRGMRRRRLWPKSHLAFGST